MDRVILKPLKIQQRDNLAKTAKFYLIGRTCKLKILFC